MKHNIFQQSHEGGHRFLRPDTRCGYRNQITQLYSTVHCMTRTMAAVGIVEQQTTEDKATMIVNEGEGDGDVGNVVGGSLDAANDTRNNTSTPPVSEKTKKLRVIEKKLHDLMKQHDMIITNMNGKKKNDEDRMTTTSNGSDKKLKIRRSRKNHLLKPHHSMKDFYTNSLFDQYARCACEANVTNFKELFESWCMATIVYEYFLKSQQENDDDTDSSRAPIVNRVADLACSHGLLSWALLVLSISSSSKSTSSTTEVSTSSASTAAGSMTTKNETSQEQQQQISPPNLSVVCIDKSMPKSVDRLYKSMTKRWPIFKHPMEDDTTSATTTATGSCSNSTFPPSSSYWDYVEGDLEGVIPHESTLLVGVHCCGILTDKVIELAISSNSNVAIVPCCHTKKSLLPYQLKHLEMIANASSEYCNVIGGKSSTNGNTSGESDEVSIEKKTTKLVVELGNGSNAGGGNRQVDSTSNGNTNGNVNKRQRRGMKSKKRLEREKRNNEKLKVSDDVLTNYIDEERVKRLKRAGYVVEEAYLPRSLTPKNRIILASKKRKTKQEKQPSSEAKESNHVPVGTAPESSSSSHTTVTENASQAIVGGSTSLEQQQLEHKFITRKNPTWGVKLFDIPIGDNPQDRHIIHTQLAGRKAAILRRNPRPRKFCIRVQLTTPNKDIPATISSVEEDTFPITVEDLDKIVNTELHPSIEGTVEKVYFYPKKHDSINDETEKIIERTYRICLQHYPDTIPTTPNKSSKKQQKQQESNAAGNVEMEEDDAEEKEAEEVDVGIGIRRQPVTKELSNELCRKLCSMLPVRYPGIVIVDRDLMTLNKAGGTNN